MNYNFLPFGAFEGVIMDKEFETKAIFKRIALTSLKNDFLWGLKMCLIVQGMHGLVKLTPVK